MRLSTKGQYAVRAMVSLACRGKGVPVSLKEIADEEGISLSYLEQLFVKLRRGALVRSVRGPGGGYLLEREPSEISVGEVITVVEEPLNPVACLDADSDACAKSDSCITQRVWKGLGDRIKEFLNSVSIQELASEALSIDPATSKPRPASARREVCRTE
jgi:Rrf2 family iron-sulfur cluster assembly transcriptional regulator